MSKIKNYTIINEKITHFLKVVETDKSVFLKEVLHPLILSIRNDSEVKNLWSYSFSKHRRSPFLYLTLWLEKIKGEVETLLDVEKQLSDAGVMYVCDDFLQKNVRKTISIVLTLKISKRKYEFINKMENYNLSQSETFLGVEGIFNQKLWFEDDSLKQKIFRTVYKMRNIAFAYQNNEDVCFFVRDIECEKISQCHIEAWENGKVLGLQSSESIIKDQNLDVERYFHDTLKIN